MGDIMETYHKSGHKRYQALSDRLRKELNDKTDELENYRETAQEHITDLYRENARLTYYTLLMKDIVESDEPNITLVEVLEEMERDKDCTRTPWQEVLDHYMTVRHMI